jgi:hypothetical protein
METDMAEVMTTDQASVADDSALFQELTTPGATPPPEPGPQDQSQPTPPAAPVAPGQPIDGEPTIPSARLRVEADRARNAERRAEALQMQVEALLQRFQPQQPQPQVKPRADMFENPSGFVQEEVSPLIEPLNQQLTQVREFYSKRDAIREFGAEQVGAAFSAIESGLRSRDPDANVTYMRLMRSLDPYGDMVRWHQQQVAFSQIGGDLSAYNKRILDEAMRNPEYQAAVIAAARGGAPNVAVPAGGSQPRTSNGQFASPATLPSIARVGSTGLSPEDAGQDNTSDAELFAQTTARGAKPPR